MNIFKVGLIFVFLVGSVGLSDMFGFEDSFSRMIAIFALMIMGAFGIMFVFAVGSALYSWVKR